MTLIYLYISCYSETNKVISIKRYIRIALELKKIKERNDKLITFLKEKYNSS